MAFRYLTFGCLVFCLALGCDETSDPDAGADAALRDAGGETDATVRDAGPTDSGPGDAGPGEDSGPSDAGPGDDAGPSDAGPSDAGPSDAGPTDGGPSDGGTSGCRCFSATQIAAIEGHGGTRACFTGMSSGTVINGELSSELDAQKVQVTVQEISGFAGVDWFCGAGCVDTNDDLVDDCAGAPLGEFGTELIDEAEHDRCEALIAVACE